MGATQTGSGGRPDLLEAGYLEYRRIEYLNDWHHAKHVGLVGMIQQPRRVSELGHLLGLNHQHEKALNAFLLGLVRLGAVQASPADSGPLFQASSKFEAAPPDAAAIARAVDDKRAREVLDSDPSRGLIAALRQPTPRPSAGFADKGPEAWDEVFQQPYYRHSRMEAVKRLAAIGGNVIDLGCGTGLGMMELAAMRAPIESMVGIDSNPAMVAVTAKRTANLPEASALVHDLSKPLESIPPRSMDAAMAVGLYHFLPAPQTLLSSLSVVLRPRGILCLAHTYFRRGSFDQELMDLRMSLGRPHGYRRSARTIERQGQEANFRLLDVPFSMGCFGFFVLERR